MSIYTKDPLAEGLAYEIRSKLNLDHAQRNQEEFQNLEELLRTSFYPDVPAFDLRSIQGINFDSWSYTEGFGCLIISTQSHEINTRLILEAAKEMTNERIFPEILFDLKNKWATVYEIKDFPKNKKIFYPPGSDTGWIINTDNVLRAFTEDESWLIKPHPYTHKKDLRNQKITFGINRMLEKQLSGMALLKFTDTIGYTTASEVGLIASYLGKKIVDFSNFEFEGLGRYSPFYRAIRVLNLSPQQIMDNIINCPWSGVIPLNIDLTLAKERFLLYKNKSIELREKYKPLTRILPNVPNENQE